MSNEALKALSPQGRENYDRIFGQKSSEKEDLATNESKPRPDLATNDKDMARHEKVSTLIEWIEDQRGSFYGYAWDSGAGSPGYDQAMVDLEKRLIAHFLEQNDPVHRS